MGMRPLRQLHLYSILMQDEPVLDYFFHYNTQANDFNIDSRLKWRFVLMFVPYLLQSEIYRDEGMFGPQNRGLAFNLNYWLTL